MAAFCSSCGSALPDAVRFCPACGATIAAKQGPSTPSGIAQPSVPPQVTDVSRTAVPQSRDGGADDRARPDNIPIAGTVLSVLVGPLILLTMRGFSHSIGTLASGILVFVLVVAALGVALSIWAFRCSHPVGKVIGMIGGVLNTLGLLFMAMGVVGHFRH